MSEQRLKTNVVYIGEDKSTEKSVIQLNALLAANDAEIQSLQAALQAANERADRADRISSRLAHYVVRLEEALRPFAEAADELDEGRELCTVRDCLAARAALRQEGG